MWLTQKKVEQSIRKWLDFYNLEDWDIQFCLVPADKPYYAKVWADPDYLKATIKYNPFKIKDLPTLDKTTSHELFHIFISPYTCAAQALTDKAGRRVLDLLEETLTTRMERVLAPLTSLRKRKRQAGA